MNFTVALVGAGNMGGAMLSGWLANGLEPANVHVIDPKPSDAMAKMLADEGVNHCVAPDGVPATDVVIIAVKPQMMQEVLPGVATLVGPETVAVSVAAGTRLEAISGPLGNPATVRAMPNTPSLVGRGMIVACPDEKVSDAQRERVHDLLQSIGRVEWVDDENLIDAVTAVSGSGPAYVFHLAECMANAGKKAGLPDELAMTLARETVSGAGELLHQASETPEVLRKNVTSPGGTTAAALEVLMRDDAMQVLFDRAIAAARKRSEELS